MAENDRATGSDGVASAAGNQPRLIEIAVEAAGGAKALAARLGVTASRISQWKRGARMTGETAIDIERVTAGAVTRDQLRPDLFEGYRRIPADGGEAA